MLHSGKSATMLPSIAASSSGHWNQDGSRRWQRAIAPSGARRTQARTSPRKPSTRARPSAASPPAGRPGSARMAPAGSRSRICSISASDWRDLVDAHPHAGVDVALLPHRHVEAQVAVGRVARQLAGVEGAPRGAADEAAGAVLAGQLPRQDAGGDGAVLQRGGAVVELDQLGEAAADGADERRQPLRARLRQVGGDAARHHAVHHQAMAEAGVGRRAGRARAGRRSGRG